MGYQNPHALAWIRKDLALNKNKPTILFHHYPFMTQVRTINRVLANIDYENNPQLKVVISGHRHSNSYFRYKGCAFINTQSTLWGGGGGTPAGFERVLATRFGIEAIDAAHEGDFAKMVALSGGEIVRVPIEDGVSELKTVDPGLFDVAGVFFG